MTDSVIACGIKWSGGFGAGLVKRFCTDILAPFPAFILVIFRTSYALNYCLAFGKIFHPFKAVYHHYRDKAFQHLIAFEAGEYCPGRRAKHRGDY